MDPAQVEGRAIKRVLGPNDFQKQLSIPRAQIRNFPTNVTSFQSRRRRTTTPKRRDVNNNNEGKTRAIDIATLMSSPTLPQRVQSPPAKKALRRTPSFPAPFSPTNANPPQPNIIASGGGSFLFSGNFNPARTTSPVVTSPVMTKTALEKIPERENPKPVTSSKKVAGAGKRVPAPVHKNPLAAVQILSDSDSESDTYDKLADEKTEFDQWADKIFEEEDEDSGSTPKPVLVPVPTKALSKKEMKKTKGKPGKNENWTLVQNNMENLPKPGQEDEETLADMAKDVAKDQLKEGFNSLLTEGGLDIGEMGENAISDMGGKLAGKGMGKLGGKLGKKLGNEKLGEEIGQEAGELLGEMATDMAKDMAKDAVGDLLSGEGLELSPPEIPDLAGKFGGKLAGKSKCSIQ